MPSEHLSHVAIPCQRVMELCKKTIRDVEEIRKKDNLESYNNKRRKIYKRKWFGLKKVSFRYETFEEFEERMRNSDCGWDSYPSIRGWGSLEVANKLLTLAEGVSDNPYVSINVTSEDYSHIS